MMHDAPSINGAAPTRLGFDNPLPVLPLRYRQPIWSELQHRSHRLTELYEEIRNLASLAEPTGENAERQKRCSARERLALVLHSAFRIPHSAIPGASRSPRP